MPYKYQYNPAATSNVSLHENGRPRDTINRHPPTEDQSMSSTALCTLTILSLILQTLLHGVVTLTLYWVFQFRWEEGQDTPFSWRGTQRGDLERQWNLHLVLMVVGFIYCLGQAMLVYRTCRCCRRIHTKLVHTFFHILAIPCIVVGFLAVWDYHSLRTDKEGSADPIPHFYSIHSWLGVTTMGLFVIQFVVGVFSFLLLLCCESSTSRYRAALVPVHSAVGTTVLLLAVATAVTGLTEKAFFELSIRYQDWVLYSQATPPDQLHSLGNTPYTYHHFMESLIINVLAVSLALVGVITLVVVWVPQFRNRSYLN